MPSLARKSFTVIGPDRRPVAIVDEYLAWLTDCERSPNTIEAYARDLRVFWTFLDEHGLSWDQVGVMELARSSWSDRPDRHQQQLEAFAKDKDDPHLDVWRQYWRRVGKSGRTGIWHETYLVKAGQYEAVYGNMQPHGLGKAGRLLPLSEASSARARLGAPSL